MSLKTKFKDEVFKERQDLPDEEMPKILEIIHYLKIGIKESKKKIEVKKGEDPLLNIEDIAVETGISDLAEQHDHYLYGVPKK